MRSGSPSIGVLAAVAAAGCAYWCAIDVILDVREPWDAAGYLILWYPMSLGLAALCGLLFEDEGWRSGPIIILAQLPVMLVANGGGGALLVFGVGLLLVLSLPAALVSGVAARIKRAAVGREAAGS